MFIFILESYLISNHTVVGRNPASPGMVLKPCKKKRNIDYQPQLVSLKPGCLFTINGYDATIVHPPKNWTHRLTVRVRLLVLSIGWPHPPESLIRGQRQDQRSWGVCYFFFRGKDRVVEAEFFGRENSNHLKSEMYSIARGKRWRNG